jgi:hypothetical protein
MNINNFSFANWLILVTVIVIITFSLIFIRKGNHSRDDSIKRFSKGFRLYLYGIGLFSLLGILGFFAKVDAIPPRFPLFFLFNFTMLFFLLRNHDKNTGFLNAIPAHWLVVFQSFRIFLELVVFALFLEGITPKEITFQGRSFEMLVGVAALPAGYFVWKGYYKIGVTFNIFGLLSLVNIIFLAVFSFPTPFRLFNENFLPTYFPGILIPLFIAPMAIFMHVLSLIQLLKFKRMLALLHQ